MMQLELRDIVTEEFQSEIQDAFAYATGFGVVFVDRAGRHIGKGSNFCRFCTAINENEETRKFCELSNQQAIALALAEEKPSIYVCHAGLINIEIPLIYDGHYLGAITAGQVLCDEMDYYPKDSVAESRFWLLNPEYAEYFGEIKVLTRHQIEATTTALRNISGYIMQTVAYSKTQQELLLYEKRQIELEHQLKLAELDALQKQVTPHFIFNVINSVSRLIAMREYDTAGDMLVSFAQMMRYTLSNIRSSVSLRQELEYIRHYLAIQQIRFGERIRYRIDCGSEAEQMQIPFFSLQPLVENSIEHGLLKLEKGGELELRCRRKGECCEIALTDNGVGIDRVHLAQIRASLQNASSQNVYDAKPGNHVGLYNSYHRLKHLYQERFTFSIDSTAGAGTRIGICINTPLQEYLS